MNSGSNRTRSDRAINVGPTICKKKARKFKLRNFFKIVLRIEGTYEDNKVEEKGSPFQKSLIGWWIHGDNGEMTLKYFHCWIKLEENRTLERHLRIQLQAICRSLNCCMDLKCWRMFVGEGVGCLTCCEWVRSFLVSYCLQIGWAEEPPSSVYHLFDFTMWVYCVVVARITKKC